MNKYANEQMGKWANLHKGKCANEQICIRAIHNPQSVRPQSAIGTSAIRNPQSAIETRFTFYASYLLLFVFLLSGSTFAQADGSTLFLRNRYHEALAAFPENPSDPQTRYRLGLCYLKLGLMYMEMHHAFLPLSTHAYEALDALKDYLGEKARPSVYTPYYLGLALCESGDDERGINALNRYLSSKNIPDLFQGYALCALGECYYRRGNQEDASATFDRLRRLAHPPSVEATLAATYQRLGIHAEVVSEVYQRYQKVSPPASQAPPRFYLSQATIASQRGDPAAALQFIKKMDVTQPDLKDRVDEVQSLEFFHPRIFRDVGEVYLRQASLMFSTLNRQLPDLDKDLRYAHALILVQLRDYDGARRVLEPFLNPAPTDDILKGCGQILLGTCYHALGQTAEARSVWQRVSTDNPILAVELASAYAAARMEPMRTAQLIHTALSSIPRITRDSPAFYPPVDAFPQREVYRRAGNALLNLSQYATAQDTAPLEMRVEENVIDIAVRTYKMGLMAAYPYAIDQPPRGNDPALLINMAYAGYKRGFTFWGGTTEAYSELQESYPELYPLHLMIQLLYAIYLNVHEEIRERAH
jgi:tetratricopeptide (TPR) repeat protein